MPEQAAKKDQFRFDGGLNTETNEISFPDGYTTNEANYELLVDGSRRRRKGLDQETDGSTKTLDTTGIGGFLDSVERTQSYLWKNVGGDPTKKFWVHKIDFSLYFTDDDDTPSDSYHAETVYLQNYSLGGVISQDALDFTQGRGDLFVAGPSMKTLRVQYDSVSDVFNVTEIELQIRDFTTIEDGTANNYQPSSAGGPPTIDDADLLDAHYYNLRNRGWKEDDMVSYATTINSWPARNQIWHKGYRRQIDGGGTYVDADGVQVFEPNKMQAHAQGASSAPLGTLLLKVFNDTIGFSESQADAGAAVLGDAVPSLTSGTGPATWEVEFDETGHARVATDTVEIGAFNIEYTNTSGGTSHRVFDGEVVTVTSTTVNAWRFQFSKPSDYASGVTLSPATWYDTRTALRSTGTGPLTNGPTSVEWHDGRLFYAGIPDPTWADYIFFSQTIFSDKELNRCHMEADPTDPEINRVVDSDGGYIVIPNIGNVQKMLSTRSGLLIFSDDGVWEVTGASGVFTPSSFQVRKVTDAESTSPESPIKVDDSVFYTGPKGIYVIGPNQFTGLLEATNVSQSLIQNAWNDMGDRFQPYVQTVYDDARRRLIFMHGGSGNHRAESPPSVYEDLVTGTDRRQYTTMLILDLRLGAWYKYEFRTAQYVGIVGAFAISGADSSDSNKKLKFIVQSSQTQVKICDFDQTDYVDFDASESPLPYMFTGWDNIGDFQRRRQAPVITVFSKRTETGYTSTGDGWDADNESSTLLTPYWDWTDDSVSGKIGSQKETYRHVRAFVPSGSTDVNGYPVVVTRNKVRGRGRVLQLRFDGAATKDSHILGYTTNYRITRRV
jgi:hypothetical protein